MAGGFGVQTSLGGGFGAPTSAVSGFPPQTSLSGGFGAKTSMAGGFGQPASNAGSFNMGGFGQPSQAGGFGQSSQAGSFGQPVGGFGGAGMTNQFNNQNGAFSSVGPTSTSAGFGAFSQAQSMSNQFGHSMPGQFDNKIGGSQGFQTGWGGQPAVPSSQPINPFMVCVKHQILSFMSLITKKNSIEIYGFTTKQALTYIYYEYYCIFTCEHVLL